MFDVCFMARDYAKTLTLALILPTMAPASALACNACVTDASEPSAAAYQAMAFLLGGLPLLIVGVFCWWYHAKTGSGDARETT